MAAIDDYQAAINQIDRQYNDLENSAIADVFSLTRQLTREIANAIADNADTDQTGLNLLRSSIDRIMSQYQSDVTNRIEQLFSDAYALGISSVIEPLAAVGDVAEPITERVTEALSLSSLLGTAAIIGASIADSIKQTVMSNIRIGRLAALSVGKLMTRIRKGIAPKLNAIRTTIRTETTRIFNIAHDLQMRAANKFRKRDNKLLKGWLTRGDNRVRPTHRAAGRAKPIPVNQLFVVGGDRLRYPGDPKGSAEEVVNCRCRMYTIPEKVLNNAKSKQIA